MKFEIVYPSVTFSGARLELLVEKCKDENNAARKLTFSGLLDDDIPELDDYLETANIGHSLYLRLKTRDAYIVRTK